ncbi:hypothetical protein QJS66_15010 [Kocuria rhizophila]|nr:hypothetical protein QJS66_15010 [Kocuria rhizophila]
MIAANELSWRRRRPREQLLACWSVVQEYVENGCTREETLPGGLEVGVVRGDAQAAAGQDRQRPPLRRGRVTYTLAVNEKHVRRAHRRRRERCSRDHPRGAALLHAVHGGRVRRQNRWTSCSPRRPSAS